VILVALLACPSPPAPVGELDDSATLPAPEEVGALSLLGEAYPNQVVDVYLEGACAAEATLVVDVGTATPVASDGAGATWAWYVPKDVARHLPETVRLTATVAASAGCAAGERTLDVDLQWSDADRTVLIVNTAVEGSADVAAAYAAFRGISQANWCVVDASDATNLSGKEFETWGRAVLDCVHAVGEHVHVLVPVYGVPYRVSDRIDDLGYPQYKATVSVDALLAWGEKGLTAEDVANNLLYQAGSSSDGEYDPYVPFPELHAEMPNRELYLVTRIDGESAEAAIELVARTELAEKTGSHGIVYVDGNRGDTPPTTDSFGSYESGEWNMWGTRRVFEADGRREVVWDGNYAEFGTDPAPLSCPDALFYAGWYSYYNYNDAFTWAPGAIGGHLDSCSACDLRSGTWSAEALKRGITATFGAVSEPYVAGMPEYDQFFLYLLQGASYGEAAYESTVIGRWMMVWVGDPWYRPFPAE